MTLDFENLILPSKDGSHRKMSAISKIYKREDRAVVIDLADQTV